MVKLPTRQTTYADYLYARMEEMLDGGGAFTIRSLADYAKLKVTGNLRRRVQHCVVAGTLAMEVALLPDSGSINVYYRPGTKMEDGTVK